MRPLALFLIGWISTSVTFAQQTNTAQFILESLQQRNDILESTSLVADLKPRTLQDGAYTSTPLSDPNSVGGKYPWKTNIMTTVFWIGEKPAKNNPVPNDKSSWDAKWMQNYGGYDCPTNRIGFRPAGFIPRQNPFYVALPYNDLDSHGLKPEASKIIPWFRQKYTDKYTSVIKGQWVAIHYNGRVCYAQWEDCGPFRTDHWQYVFGNERPKSNINHAAGLDISPAVRDYLGLKTNDYTDWKFVDIQKVPSGPWAKYGENNPLSPYSQQPPINTYALRSSD
jgi:hypothetical protein